MGGRGISRFPFMVLAYVLGVSDRAGSAVPHDLAARRMLPSALTRWRRRPENHGFAAQYPAHTLPANVSNRPSRVDPHDFGVQDGSLLLSRRDFHPPHHAGVTGTPRAVLAPVPSSPRAPEPPGAAPVHGARGRRACSDPLR